MSNKYKLIKQMSISLIQLYNFLTNKNTSQKIDQSIINKKLNEKIYTNYEFNVTNFSYNNTLNNLYFFLMYSKLIDGFNNKLFNNLDYYDRNIVNFNDPIFEKLKESLTDYINDEEFDFSISKKKIIQLIRSNEYNHEILLILSQMYNINIFIFFKDINIFKSYYVENTFNIHKPSIFLQYHQDTFSNSYTLQLLFSKNKFIFEWENISNIINNHISDIYSIGIEDNKKFIINYNPTSIKENKINSKEMVNIIDYLVDTKKINDFDYYKQIVNL
jgi:hypothetical protein